MGENERTAGVTVDELLLSRVAKKDNMVTSAPLSYLETRRRELGIRASAL